MYFNLHGVPWHIDKKEVTSQSVNTPVPWSYWVAGIIIGLAPYVIVGLGILFSR